MNLLKWTVAAAATLMLAGPAHASKHISKTVKIPASVVAQLQTPDGCDNTGNTIDISGIFSGESVGATIYLQNNTKGTHQRQFDAEAAFSLYDFGQQTFAKQGSLGGVGGNPWIALSDSYSGPDGATIVGRCVQGLDAGAVMDFLLDAQLELDVSTDSDSCIQSGGPRVYINGSLLIGGVDVVVYLQNKRSEPTHWDSTDAQLSLEVTPNETINIAKSPHLDGVGGNPLVYVEIDGELFSLGRCNKI